MPAVFARRIALFGCSLLLGFGLAEGVARLVRPVGGLAVNILTPEGEVLPVSEVIHYLYRTGASDRYAGEGPRSRLLPNMQWLVQYPDPLWGPLSKGKLVEFKLNSLGFRDQPFEVTKAPDEFRVLAVGDSVTMGIGVNLEDTWVQQLETCLASREPGPVQVINGGFATGSHYPGGYIDWIDDCGFAFDPDLLVIMVTLNDLNPEIPMAAFPEVVEHPWFNGASQFLKIIQIALHVRHEKQIGRDYYFLIEKDPHYWKETRKALWYLNQRCQEQGIEFLVAVAPMFTALDKCYPYHRLHDEVRNFCDQQGIRHVDLLADVQELGRESATVHPSDQHPNAAAHGKLAKGIEKYLVSNDLLPH